MRPPPLGKEGARICLHLHRRPLIWGTRIDEGLYQSLDHRGVGRVPGRQVEPELFAQVVLLKVRQEVNAPTPSGRGVEGTRVGRRVEGIRHIPGRELAQRIVVAVHGQPDLLQVVRTLHPGCGLADLLNCRQ